MSVDPGGTPKIMFGRGGRRHRGGAARASGNEPQPRLLAAAGFLAHLRSGAVADAGRAELLGGRVVFLPRLLPAQAAAVLGLHARLAAALGPWSPSRSSGAAYRPPAEAIKRPLLGLGPEDLLRPEIAVLATPARWLEEPEALGQPRERALAGESLGSEGVVLAVELAIAGRNAGGRSRTEGAVTARLAAYARAGVREVWLLDLHRGWTEAYRAPWSGSFRSRTLWYPGEEVPLSSLPGVTALALETG